MKLIENFKYEVKKEDILKILRCNNESNAYLQICDICDLILKDIDKIISPKALYKFKNMNNNIDVEEIKSLSSIVYCFLTLGDKISEEIERYFKEDKYIEGMILDTIADYILFDLSNQLYEMICEEAKNKGLGLTNRFSPGSEGFPIEKQKYIIDEFSEFKDLKIEITEGFMLKPLKSLTFVMGADKCLNIKRNENECLKCTSINCPFRKDLFPEDSKINLTVIKGEKEINIKADKSKNILKNLNDNNIFIDSPCGGNGTCGKCKVKVIKGKIKRLKNNNLLGEHLLSDGWCLACSTYLESDCIIKIEDDSRSFNILNSFEKNRIEIKPKYKSEEIEIDIDKLKGDSLVNYINCKFKKEYIYNLKVLRRMSEILNDVERKCTYNIIINDNKVVDINKSSEKKVYGIAIDIGTTTIVISLLDLLTGRIIRSHSLLNSQRKFGADVISRIHYSMENGIKPLNESIKKDIEDGIKYILNKENIDKKDIHEIAVAGNTIMLYLLLGLECKSLSFVPFNTVTTSMLKFNYKDIFNDFLDCTVTLLPCISAYVGADILSGMLYCGFDKIDKISMLIDIGTNGEMLIGNKNKILCLATAAGPAFEGANITCGTGSINGAICSVDIKDNKLVYKTIGDITPVGICGSAVIDIAALSLINCIIDETGRFDTSKYNDFFIIAKDKFNKDIIFNQKDIREVQLAKSAIRSGIEILIKEFNCSYEDIDTVFIAGGFGNYMNIDNAITIGLIPKELKEKIKNIGNSSLAGAIKYLIDKDTDIEIYNILDKIKYIDISSNEHFNDLFVENMLFQREVII